MTTFRNDHDQTLSFSIIGTQYDVAPGATVEIPPAHEPFIRSRGIALSLAAGQSFTATTDKPLSKGGVRKVGA